MELRRRALQLLLLAEPHDKATRVREWAGVDASAAEVDVQAVLSEPAGLPGRPTKPRRVPPGELAARSAFTPEGRAALLHAVAHIEFNAINLALDAVWRFAQLPRPYYLEWMQVAREEALHFTLVADHLKTLGRVYGDYDAHDGLWAMAERTRADPLARMALVPRTLEARGLDVTPA
ncbi:MAG TPA: ferritin-like domain-containing protein, partial [Burkholderiaceae bacterium]|nr:ferritin-like domain-containing protein [Burkholderiaceae bacterium]